MSQEGEWEEKEEKKEEAATTSQTTYVDQQTGANVSIDDALNKSLVDKGTAQKFKMVSFQRTKV